jgi:hypothetical protein
MSFNDLERGDGPGVGGTSRVAQTGEKSWESVEYFEQYARGEPWI